MSGEAQGARDRLAALARHALDGPPTDAKPGGAS